jgi:serine/threonine-protein kinase
MDLAALNSKNTKNKKGLETKMETPEDQVGTCRIIGEIGSGGMSVVYRAIQESLRRTVAVKTLRPSAANEPQLAQRFEREALSIAALQHENIINVHDFINRNGQLYIIMEHVEGIDLYDLLDRSGHLPVDVAAIIAMQVGRALDYAHYRGIVHRDIKPANVMISHQGGVKLMDFGIARDESFADLTETGTGVGTPSYMSPEQILGDRIDFRSDLFSLGILLYQMVTGRKPFVEDERKSVMHKIRLEPAEDPRRTNPDVPRELVRIIETCMKKRPADRFRSTQELVLALERFLGTRVEMNYYARLVVFLQGQGIVGAEQAERVLRPAMAGEAARAAHEATQRSRLLRLATQTQAAVLAAAAALLTVVHLAAARSHKTTTAPVATTSPPTADAPSTPAATTGQLALVVYPWADVIIDGRRIDTTPLAQPIRLPPGRHSLELRNPYFPAITRTLTIAPYERIELAVDLTTNGHQP